MKKGKLQYTYFQVERLKNVVGIGRSAAHQVITSPGEVVGVLGAVVNPANINAVNDPQFSRKSNLRFNTWLKRSLTALGL